MMTTDFRSVLCHGFQRHHTHLSAADSLQPDTALLQSSAQLSVVRFLPSLLAFCQLSMVMIHLCPVISLKLSCHKSKCCSNCKITVCIRINVQGFVWFQSLMWQNTASENKSHISLVVWVRLGNSQSSLYGGVSLEGHVKITCVSFLAERCHCVDTQQMNIKPWERKMCSEQISA